MKHLFHLILLSLLGCVTIVFIIITLNLHFYLEEHSNIYFRDSHDKDINFKDVNVPVILWWTPFTGEKAAFKRCGNVECFFTENRLFQYHDLMKVIVFYGSKFDVLDLPLPRNGTHVLWALFHEESPKNTPVLSHNLALQLFNFTATFSRFSSFPLTLQYLPNLELLTGHLFLVPLQEKNMYLKEIAPVLYIHSDCNTPLERDSYVSELMKWIAIDSYGACLNNRKLPESLADPLENLDSDEFFRFVAKYKFTLSFENSVCNDYITEKLWRPLIVGSIPVYLGSPSVQNWLPNKKSAILVSDFESPKALAQFIHQVNFNDSLYKSYLEHKLNFKTKRVSNVNLITAVESRTWGVNDFEKGNMVEHFECFICTETHKQRYEIAQNVANISHYDCPVPVSPITLKTNSSNWWVDQWKMGRCESESLNHFVRTKRNNYTKEEFYSKVQELLLLDKC